MLIMSKGPGPLQGLAPADHPLEWRLGGMLSQEEVLGDLPAGSWHGLQCNIHGCNKGSRRRGARCPFAAVVSLVDLGLKRKGS